LRPDPRVLDPLDRPTHPRRDNLWEMVESEQQPNQPKREFLKDMAPWAETLSKAIAGIAIALYASGFLVVSLYHSKFGFVGTNPFRPRVLAAGAWFFFFTALPVSIAVRFRAEPWKNVARNAYAWIAFYGLSIPLGYLFLEFSPYQPSITHSKWSVVLPTVLLAASLLFGFLTYIKKIPQWVAIVSSVTLTLYWAMDPVRRFFTDHRFDLTSVVLWFFAIMMVVKLEFEVRSNRNLAEGGEWSKPLVLLFGLLLIFSRELYPHLKTSWGGGTPADVTVYFTKDSLLSPNKAVQAQLIEESDEGFYIVGPKEAKAIFIPRHSVALVYFSDKAADSPLLQGNKELSH